MKDLAILSLGLLRSYKDGSAVSVPYWFDRKNRIHLAESKNKNIEIDLNAVQKDLLVEISNALKEGLLRSDRKDEIMAKAAESYEKNEVSKEEEQVPIRPTIDKKAVLKKQEDELKKKAQAELDDTIINLTSKIGGGLLDEETLSAGMDNYKLLRAMLEVELKAKKTRQQVLKLLRKRIEAIEAISLVIPEKKDKESGFDIEVEENNIPDKTLVLDKETQSYSEVTTETQEVKE